MRATSPRITGFGYARVGMIASEMLTPDKYSQMKLACQNHVYGVKEEARMALTERGLRDGDARIPDLKNPRDLDLLISGRSRKVPIQASHYVTFPSADLPAETTTIVHTVGKDVTHKFAMDFYKTQCQRLGAIVDSVGRDRRTQIYHSVERKADVAVWPVAEVRVVRAKNLSQASNLQLFDYLRKLLPVWHIEGLRVKKVGLDGCDQLYFGSLKNHSHVIRALAVIPHREEGHMKKVLEEICVSVLNGGLPF